MNTGMCKYAAVIMQILETQYSWTLDLLQTYSQTLEKRSSDPPNPPDLLFVLVVGLETGAALAQPPKSSSAATVGAGLEAVRLGAPQPWPTSFGVKVSGTFIRDAGEGAA